VSVPQSVSRLEDGTKKSCEERLLITYVQLTAIDASNRVKEGPLTMAVMCSAAAIILFVASAHCAAALSAAPGVKGLSSEGQSRCFTLKSVSRSLRALPMMSCN
jgi:hypothetical protein